MSKDSDIMEALRRAYFLIETHNIQDDYFNALREKIKDILPSQICGLEFFIKTGKVTMTVTETLQLIIKNSHVPALNYCISYAEYALDISDRCDIEQDREFKTQLLHVLNNMSQWRQCKASTTTAAEIKECRVALKKGNA